MNREVRKNDDAKKTCHGKPEQDWTLSILSADVSVIWNAMFLSLRGFFLSAISESNGIIDP